MTREVFMEESCSRLHEKKFILSLVCIGHHEIVQV